MSCGRSTIKEGGGRVLGSTRATYRHTNQRNERGEVVECEYERRARLTGRKISKAALPQDEKRSNKRRTNKACKSPATQTHRSAAQRSTHSMDCSPCRSIVLVSNGIFSIKYFVVMTPGKEKEVDGRSIERESIGGSIGYG